MGSGTTRAVPDMSHPRHSHAGEPLLAPQEILTALLALNPKAENLPLKAIMGAINHCFAMRDADMGPAFHSEALASTMQQLVVRQEHCIQIPFLTATPVELDLLASLECKGHSVGPPHLMTAWRSG